MLHKHIGHCRGNDFVTELEIWTTATKATFRMNDVKCFNSSSFTHELSANILWSEIGVAYFGVFSCHYNNSMKYELIQKVLLWSAQETVKMTVELNMKLCPVEYLGFTAMDKRFSRPMLPWVIAEIKRRGTSEKVRFTHLFVYLVVLFLSLWLSGLAQRYHLCTRLESAAVVSSVCRDGT
jgi:hypothetical protein